MWCNYVCGCATEVWRQHMSQWGHLYGHLQRPQVSCSWLIVSMLRSSDVVITEYCLPSDLMGKSAASLQLKISASYIISRSIIYILKIGYSTVNVVMIYLNFIVVNLTSTSFTVSILTEHTATVSCRFASVFNVYKASYQQHY